MKNNVFEKIKTVMVGHAVGDALGVPVEFASREELKNAPVTDMEGYGTYPVPAGAWSDDTSMSLAALDALSKEEFSWDDVMINFGKWLQEGEYTPTGECFDAGKTCVMAILNYFSNKLSPNECGGASEHSNGNGSLMRIHPFVLYASLTMLNGNSEDYWSWMGFIKQASSLTHAHDRSVMGCTIYGYILTFLMRESSGESLKKGIEFAGKDLDYLPEFEHYKRIFEPDFDKLPETEIKSSGYVVDTMEAAVWCLLTTDSYEKCVLKAVNLGDDTDTVAAVAGGLAGLLYGYDAIPQKWIDRLIKRDYIEDLCKKAAEAWKK